MSCTVFWPSFVAKTACSKATSAIFAGMALVFQGAGAAAGSVAGGAEAAGVCAIPAVAINPAPSAETRISVRFIRSVVLLQEIVSTEIDFCLRQHCLRFPRRKGLHANSH